MLSTLPLAALLPALVVNHRVVPDSVSLFGKRACCEPQLTRMVAQDLPDTPSKPPKRVAREALPCQRCLRSLMKGRNSMAGKALECDTGASRGLSRCERCVKGKRAGKTGCRPVSSPSFAG